MRGMGSLQQHVPPSFPKEANPAGPSYHVARCIFCPTGLPVGTDICRECAKDAYYQCGGDLFEAVREERETEHRAPPAQEHHPEEESITENAHPIEPDSKPDEAIFD